MTKMGLVLEKGSTFVSEEK